MCVLQENTLYTEYTLITCYRKRYQLGEGIVPLAVATSVLMPSEGVREDKRPVGSRDRLGVLDAAMFSLVFLQKEHLPSIPLFVLVVNSAAFYSSLFSTCFSFDSTLPSFRAAYSGLVNFESL